MPVASQATGRHFMTQYRKSIARDQADDERANGKADGHPGGACCRKNFVHSVLLLEPFVIDGLVSAVFLHFFQRSVKFLLRGRCCPDVRQCRPGAEIGFVGHFIAHGRRLRIALQPFRSPRRCHQRDRVDTTVLQVQLRILVAVVRHGSDFRMFIGDEFLIGWCRSARPLFALQLVNAGELLPCWPTNSAELS